MLLKPVVVTPKPVANFIEPDAPTPATSLPALLIDAVALVKLPSATLTTVSGPPFFKYSLAVCDVRN